MNFENPAAANILNEERLDEALEAFYSKKKLTPLDQKILLGIVSRVPAKYTESKILNSKGQIDDSDSSSCEDSPDPEEIEKKRKTRNHLEKIKKTLAQATIDSSMNQSHMIPGQNADKVTSHNNNQMFENDEGYFNEMSDNWNT